LIVVLVREEVDIVHGWESGNRGGGRSCTSSEARIRVGTKKRKWVAEDLSYILLDDLFDLLLLGEGLR